ncbi:right-handed parallel beta-helix repeat-containing protein [Chitinimonas lacunae]|uniref:Right-handed parallel beta-helix repeat-containing protein n=1 Tax=Chitinimonas lacunae TaxID=1963018 RepID=A0ABV8MMA5_9NEIS
MKHSRKPALSVLAAAIALLAVPAQAASYYVASDGSDSNSGSEQAPFATLGHVLPRLVAGDSLTILGEYTLTAPISLPVSGTAIAPITLRGQSKQLATGGTQASDVKCLGLDACIALIGRDHVRISGFKLTGGIRAPIWIQNGKHLEISDNQLFSPPNVSGSDLYGIYLMPNSGDGTATSRRHQFVTISGNTLSTTNSAMYLRSVADLKVVNNTVYNVPKGDGIVLARTNRATVEGNRVSGLRRSWRADCKIHAFAAGIKVRESEYVSIVSNSLSDITGPGIQVRRMDESVKDRRSRHITISDNVVTDTVKVNMPPPGSPLPPTQHCGLGWPSAVVVSRADVIRIENNLVGRNWGEGIALNSSTSAVIEGNTAFDNFGVNIYLNNASDSEVVRNFVSYSKEPHGYPYYRKGFPASGITMANEKSDEAMELDNRVPLRNLVVANNIVRGGRAGISYFWAEKSDGQEYHSGGLQFVRIFHNTVYGSKENALIDITESGPGTEQHRDIHLNSNIFIQPNGGIYLRNIRPGPHAVTSYAANFWCRTSALPGSVCMLGTAGHPAQTPKLDQERDPMLALSPPGNDSPKDYGLQDSSPARFAALRTFGEKDYVGMVDFFGTERRWDRSDVGAHEVRETLEIPVR